MKKIRLESFERFEGMIPIDELVKIAFAQIDTNVSAANKILLDCGIVCEYPQVLILNGKEYLRPPECSK